MQTTITSASAAAETASPIPRTRSTCQFSEGGAVFYAWNPGNMIEFTRQGLVNRIVTICKLIATLTLPGVRPAAVETAHGIGIGAGEQDTRRLRER